MDVAEAIDAEAVAVTFQAPAEATYDDGGNAVFGPAPATSPGLAVLQPVSGRALMDLPEGLRSEASLLGWTRVEVALGWKVIYGGETFRVIHTWSRPMDGFTKFAVARTK